MNQQQCNNIHAKEQAALDSLMSRLAYFMDGSYTAYDTIRSLCQEAMGTIENLVAQVKLQQTRIERLEIDKEGLQMGQPLELHGDAARSFILAAELSNAQQANERLEAEVANLSEKYNAFAMNALTPEEILNLAAHHEQMEAERDAVVESHRKMAAAHRDCGGCASEGTCRMGAYAGQGCWHWGAIGIDYNNAGN